MPYWKLYYHFILGTKNRLPLIDSTLEPELFRAILAKYIHHQKQHHAEGSLIAAMEKMNEK